MLCAVWCLIPRWLYPGSRTDVTLTAGAVYSIPPDFSSSYISSGRGDFVPDFSLILRLPQLQLTHKSAFSSFSLFQAVRFGSLSAVDPSTAGSGYG